LIQELAEMVQAGHQPDADSTRDSARMLLEDEAAAPAMLLNASYIRTPGKSIRAKTEGQQQYLAAIDENTVVMGIGPAGTGKTYLAVAKAVEALYAKKVGRIVLTRPVVEAGERLGFLPGTLSEKIDPYLRPLFDALQEMLGAENTAKLVETGVIELAPLAYMRGRTLSDAFVILDEAQNTSVEQMKMFLTRLGANSKMVVTGDITQVDLPGGKSGLIHAVGILDSVDGLAISELTSADVVRHDMVARIVEAYDRGNS
jgi:phosphate starvation-inducible PhoH-like protein